MKKVLNDVNSGYKSMYLSGNKNGIGKFISNLKGKNRKILKTDLKKFDIEKYNKVFEERGVLFKKYGYSHLEAYNKAIGTEKLKQIFICLDIEKDKLSQKELDGIDRVLRVGRVFGVTLVLMSSNKVKDKLLKKYSIIGNNVQNRIKFLSKKTFWVSFNFDQCFSEYSF